MPRVTNETLLVLKLAEERAKTLKPDQWHVGPKETDTKNAASYEVGFEHGIHAYRDMLDGILRELGYK